MRASDISQSRWGSRFLLTGVLLLVLSPFGYVAGRSFLALDDPSPALGHAQVITQGISVTDQAARAEIYQQIQALLLADLPWINLFIANQYEAMKTDVKGYVHIPTGSNLSLRETWLDR